MSKVTAIIELSNGEILTTTVCDKTEDKSKEYRQQAIRDMINNQRNNRTLIGKVDKE